MNRQGQGYLLSPFYETSSMTPGFPMLNDDGIVQKVTRQETDPKKSGGDSAGLSGEAGSGHQDIRAAMALPASNAASSSDPSGT
jgi:hypothetical protein